MANEETTYRPANDAYTGMLVISLLALIAGSTLLYVDYIQYPEANPKPPPKSLPEAFKKGPPEEKPPEVKEEPKKDDEKKGEPKMDEKKIDEKKDEPK